MEAMSPLPASPAERTKRRPTPLLLEALLGSFDSNDDYQAHRVQPPHGLASTEVPVRRTFIEYGCQSDSYCGQQAVSTAPACMSLSAMRGNILNELCGEDDASPSTCSPSDAGRSSGRSSEDADWPVMGPTVLVADRLPAVLYHMSPTSAKAAGYWTRETSARSSRSFPSQPVGGSDRIQDEAEAAEVGSSASTGEDQESDDDEDRHFCPEYSKDAKLPSAGSALHGEGQCKRCCFFPKGRCNNGESCQFCHFAHEKRKPKHKKKTKKHRKSKRAIITTTPLTPGPQMPFKCPDLGGEEPCLFMSAIIPSQVVVDASFPHATAVAVVPVPFVY